MTNAAAEKAIFQAALFIADPAQLAEYLDVSCQDNAEMRRRAESLLAASEDENFMRGQAMDSVLESPERDVVYRTCPGLGEQPGDQVGNYKLLQRIGLVILHKSVRFPPGLSRRDHNWLATKVQQDVVALRRACPGGSHD